MVFSSKMRSGNESSAAQLGEAGVRAVQVREHHKFNEVTSCFFLLRNDGSVDDVSARKCVARVFPSWGAAHSGKFSGPKVCTPVRFQWSWSGTVAAFSGSDGSLALVWLQVPLSWNQCLI